MGRRGSGKRKAKNPFQAADWWLKRARNTQKENTPGYQSGIAQNELRRTGRDNPCTLSIQYGHGNLTLAAGVVGISKYFTPTDLPGWSSLKGLFREFKLQKAELHFVPLKGTDIDGGFSQRYTPSSTETITSTVTTEQQRGGKLTPLASLKHKAMSLFEGYQSDQFEFHQVDNVTDSNNYGYNKEFGQLFLRAEDLTGSSSAVLGRYWIEARVTFRGYIA